MIVKSNLRAIKVTMMCDKCEIGVMVKDDLVLTCNPPKYKHECNNCGAVELYERAYPTVDFEDE